MTRSMAMRLGALWLSALAGMAIFGPTALAAPVPEPPAGEPTLRLPDGKLFFTGNVSFGAAEPYTRAFAVWKRNADGKPDTSFHGDGLATVAFWGEGERAMRLAVQPDGRVVVAGLAWDPVCGYACEQRVAIVRFDADGALDASFNGSGRLAFSLTYLGGGSINGPPGREASYDETEVALLADGTILIGSGIGYPGFLFYARVRADGTLDGALDNSFGHFTAKESPLIQAQGLWHAAPPDVDTGWGIAFAHQGEIIFATWYTYDANGRPRWLVASLRRAGDALFGGTLYETTGPPVSAGAFDAARVTRRAVGGASVAFADRDHASFTYELDGIDRTVGIERVAFGPLPLCAFGSERDLARATNYQDLWGAAPLGSENGWGLSLAHQGELIFATWYTYDTDGRPLWLAGTAYPTGDGAYAGTLGRTSGPAPGAQLRDGTALALTAVGSFRLGFTDGNTGSFAYRYAPGAPGVAIEATKAITRQVFREPGTSCRQAPPATTLQEAP